MGACCCKEGAEDPAQQLQRKNTSLGVLQGKYLTEEEPVAEDIAVSEPISDQSCGSAVLEAPQHQPISARKESTAARRICNCAHNEYIRSMLDKSLQKVSAQGLVDLYSRDMLELFRTVDCIEEVSTRTAWSFCSITGFPIYSILSHMVLLDFLLLDGSSRDLPGQIWTRANTAIKIWGLLSFVKHATVKKVSFATQGFAYIHPLAAEAAAPHADLLRSCTSVTAFGRGRNVCCYFHA